MSNIQAYIFEHFVIIFIICIAWSVAVFAWLFWRRKQRNLFSEKAEGIIYQENFASGSSHKSWLTKGGGARNCLRLIITENELWITPIFPLTAFAGLFDLDHRILREKITAVKLKKLLFMHSIVITYQDAENKYHTVEVVPRKIEKFNSALAFTGQVKTI